MAELEPILAGQQIDWYLEATLPAAIAKEAIDLHRECEAKKQAIIAKFRARYRDRFEQEVTENMRDCEIREGTAQRIAEVELGPLLKKMQKAMIREIDALQDQYQEMYKLLIE